MDEEPIDIEVGGFIDAEMKDHVLTLIGMGGTVAVTTVDGNGTVLYTYDPRTGWTVRQTFGITPHASGLLN